MFPVFALVFLVIPVVEIYILIQVGEIIGALWTIAIVILTAIVGVRLLKLQGLSTLLKAQQKMQTGSIPAIEMMEGVALIVAGAFLLTPGFFTDAVGFLLLFPLTRQMIIALFADKVMVHMQKSTFSTMHSTQSPFEQRAPSTDKRQGDVIEGVKYHETKDKDTD